MKTPTLYLDTSVLGGFFDDEFRVATRALWHHLERGRFRPFTSVVTLEELEDAPERVRQLVARTFPAEHLLDITPEMEELAEAYLREAVLTPKYSDDARHVAACTVARVDYLVSWNFRHLVNVEREKGFNAVNLLQGYTPVRIVNPWELIYVDDE